MGSKRGVTLPCKPRSPFERRELDLSVKFRPSPRHLQCVDVTVFFAQGQTWEYENTAWTLMHPAASPDESHYYYKGAAFSTANNHLLLFGMGGYTGRPGYFHVSEAVWEYDGVT